MKTSEDYFFIIEHSLERPDPAYHPIDIYARGKGRETVEALGRAMLRDEFLSQGRLTQTIASSHGQRMIRELVSGDSDEFENEDHLHLFIGDISPFMGHADDLVWQHEAVLRQQYLKGVRSLESVLRELRSGTHDQKLVNKAAGSLFTPAGEKLQHLWDRKRPTGDRKRLRLPLDIQAVGRMKVTEEAEVRARDLLFENIPTQATGQALEVLDLRRKANGEISAKKPLTPRGMEPKRIYGFVDGGEFVPIYDRTNEMSLI